MKVLGDDVNFKENLIFSLKYYRLLWIILLITVVFDFLTTLYFVGKFGVGLEANLIARFLMVNLGTVVGALLGKLLQLVSVVCIASLNRRVGNVFLVVVIVLNIIAVVINTHR